MWLPCHTSKSHTCFSKRVIMVQNEIPIRLLFKLPWPVLVCTFAFLAMSSEDLLNPKGLEGAKSAWPVSKWRPALASPLNITERLEDLTWERSGILSLLQPRQGKDKLQHYQDTHYKGIWPAYISMGQSDHIVLFHSDPFCLAAGYFPFWNIKTLQAD